MVTTAKSGRASGAAMLQLAAAVFAFGLAAPAANAASGSFADNTFLLNVTQRTRLSDAAWRLGDGGYELAGGAFVEFRKWYEPRWIDLDFHFLTQISENVGMLWGFSTGEWGAKYRIHPSYKLGFIVQHAFTPQASLSISVTRRFGGGLEERSCVADYGEIGGVQRVHCRLAAAMIEPAETLQYLYRTKPLDTWVGLRLQAIF